MAKLDYNSDNVFHSVTLVPRLDYSHQLIDTLAELLKEKRRTIKKTNQDLPHDIEESDFESIQSLKYEHTIAFCLECVLFVQKVMHSIHGVASIPQKIPLLIPILRVVSAELFDIMPECSKKLCELSVHLGSIVLDSAALTKARFDFSQSNTESSNILDEVKLIVDSKINKQYPNLDFLKH